MTTSDIESLGEALLKAAREDDWLRVQQIDEKICQLLQTIQNKGIEPNTLPVIKKLHQRHVMTMAICRDRMTTLGEQMKYHQRSREGLQAYALHTSEQELQS